MKRAYTAADVGETPLEDIGLPGPLSLHARALSDHVPEPHSGRCARLPASASREDTNKRFKYLIAQGQTGISTDFDMPTLMGYDSDHPMSDGEVGREGVAIDTLADMEALLEGIDLENISVSMTINPTAWILLAMYVALAEKRGYDLNRLSGTVQADILKEYMAQKEYIYPVAPSVRIVRDIITYCAKNMKRYNPINVSGYHISEAGSSPLHEAAFTLANLIVYVEEVLKTGMSVDEFAPRLAFFFVCQADFFEEIAKFRALRRCYAKIMKERFGAKNPESMRLRFHCQTAAASLTKPQYMINIVRTTLEALSAVLGGAQSLHTNGYDEAFAIPTEDAMKMALRTQQIIAEESHVTDVVDPLGGSYFVEALTTRLREAHLRDSRRRSSSAAAPSSSSRRAGSRSTSPTSPTTSPCDGNRATIRSSASTVWSRSDEKFDIELHPYDPLTAERQTSRTQRVRRERDDAKVQALLKKLVDVAKDDTQNIMPVTIELVREGATMGDSSRR